MRQTFFFGPLPCGLEYEQSILELKDVQANGMMRFPLQARAYGLPGLVFHIVVEMDGVHGSCSLNRYVALQRRYVPMSGGSKGSVNLGYIWPMGVRRSRYDQ